MPVSLLTCKFLLLGFGACGASWARGYPVAPLALFVSEVCFEV